MLDPSGRSTVDRLGLKAERGLEEPQRLVGVLIAKARVSSHDTNHGDQRPTRIGEKREPADQPHDRAQAPRRLVSSPPLWPLIVYITRAAAPSKVTTAVSVKASNGTPCHLRIPTRAHASAVKSRATGLDEKQKRRHRRPGRSLPAPRSSPCRGRSLHYFLRAGRVVGPSGVATTASRPSDISRGITSNAASGGGRTRARLR